MSVQPIEVAICFDRHIEEPALVFLASLLVHSNPQRLTIVHAVTDGLSKEGEASLLQLARPHFAIDLIKVHNAFSDFDALGHISSGTYLRFMLPELLLTCKKVLYLDVDLIVRRDISELFDTDLEGCPLAAVPDYSQLNSSLTWRAWRIEYQGVPITFTDYLTSVLALDPCSKKPYFNCGVMLLDLDIWRSARVVERAVALLREKPGLRFLDQDALNHIIGETYKVLDPRWNALAANTGKVWLHWRDRWRPRTRRWLGIRRLWRTDPWIIHFAGPAKPWQRDADPTLLDAYWWKAAADLQTARNGLPLGTASQPARAQSAAPASADAD